MTSSPDKHTIPVFSLNKGQRSYLDEERLQTYTSELLTCLIHTRKACTSLFQKYVGSLEPGLQYLYVGACTLFIGPHSFPGTKFYRVLHPNLETPSENVVGLTEKAPYVSDLSLNTLSDVPESHAPGELIFELQEDPSETWLFPEEAVVEATNISEPFEIIANISVIPREKKDPSSAQTSSTMTIHLSKVPKELWVSMKQVTKDVSLVYGYMTDKVKYLPNRLYVEYSSPCELPRALIKKSRSPSGDLKETSIIKTPTNSTERRPSDFNSETRRNPKKSKSLGSSEAKKPKPAAVVSRKNSNSYHSTNGNGKKCAYCGCKSTPMWRRGPAGAGTLCNACGVKWKHGKILQDVAVNSDDLKPVKAVRSNSPTGSLGSSLPTTPLAKLKSKFKPKSNRTTSPDLNGDVDTSDKDEPGYKIHPNEHSNASILKTPNRNLATPLKKRKFPLPVPNHSFSERYNESSRSI